MKSKIQKLKQAFQTFGPLDLASSIGLRPRELISNLVFRIWNFPKSFARGYIVMFVLVFGSIFGILVGGLAGFVMTQGRAGQATETRATAFELAEAGLSYYKWYLAHNPGDYQDGTGEEGPYVHDYYDPEGGLVGTFELEIDPNLVCGEATSISIRSTGKPDGSVFTDRTVEGTYARPSVAEYAYIINSNVWAGSDREIHGKYHSNGGIRMDGSNDSRVTSAQEDWLCTSSFGCSPQSTEGGVFGDGEGGALWDFPVPQMDFGGITVNLVELEEKADQDGLFFHAIGGQSNKRGYHLVFQSNGTVDAYRVTDTDRVRGYNHEEEWHWDYHIIDDETYLGNYDIPDDCSVIFVEDRLWIEGEVSGKVTVAAAKINQPNFSANVILNGNITYANGGDTDGLTVIAEESVLIPLMSPDDMVLNGIFIAQNGRFGRNHYEHFSYWPHISRNTLTINGTIVSNGRVGTQWNDDGTFMSGYVERINTYDRKQATNPPPLTPYTSNEYRFTEWRDHE